MDRYRITEIGLEARCAKCREFWPADAEFYYLDKNGKPHCYCKACYTEWAIARGNRGRTGTGTVQDHVRAA